MKNVDSMKEMIKRVLAVSAVCAALAGCTAGSGNFTGEAEKGLGYCAGQTERTLAQISPAGTEIDYAIIYADYYYIEALLRLKNKKI